jgi:uncharacterized membrane protein YphA (DoxX/SURF4 family)
MERADAPRRRKQQPLQRLRNCSGLQCRASKSGQGKSTALRKNVPKYAASSSRQADSESASGAGHAELVAKGFPRTMMKYVSLFLAIALLGVHALLVVIGIGGLVEWFVPDPPWTRFSNPELTPWMLMLQWLLMLGAGVLFIAGYLARWRALPWALMATYAVMAATCAYQTVFMLTHDSKWMDMAIEYLQYTAILLFLFFDPLMRQRFRPDRLKHRARQSATA